MKPTLRIILSITLACVLGAPSGLAQDSEPAAPAIPDLHERPIVEEGGRTLLWANETEDGEIDWFDVTDATIDPHRFQFGIGRDTIDSIDEPEFVSADDPRGGDPGAGHQ